MEELFRWDERYVLGIHSVDQQHKQLVEIINQLHGASLRGEKRETISAILASLVHYTRVHFSDEETMLESAGYPDLDMHRSKHQGFVSHLSDMQHRFDGGQDVAGDLLAFLRDWLAGHILGTDKRYLSHVSAATTGG